MEKHTARHLQVTSETYKCSWGEKTNNFQGCRAARLYLQGQLPGQTLCQGSAPETILSKSSFYSTGRCKGSPQPHISTSAELCTQLLPQFCVSPLLPASLHPCSAFFCSKVPNFSIFSFFFASLVVQPPSPKGGTHCPGHLLGIHTNPHSASWSRAVQDFPRGRGFTHNKLKSQMQVHLSVETGEEWTEHTMC